MYLDVPVAIEGDATVVTARASSFLTTADTILRAAADLSSIVDEQETIGLSIDAVRSMAYQVREEIALAEARYRETALALQDFAPVLADATQRADVAVSAWYPQARLADSTYFDFVNHTGDEVEREEARERWLRADARLATLRGDYQSAVDDLRVASNAAAARVRAVVDHSDLNDSFWDDLSGIGSAIGAWFDDVFGPFIDDLLSGLGKILTLAAYALSAVMLLALSPFIAVDLYLALAHGNDAALDEAVALITFGLAPMLGAAWLTGRGDPRLIGSSADDSDRGDGARTPFSTFMRDQGDIDAMGADSTLGADSAVVQVTTTVGPDGVTRYSVQVPSTQQWFSFNGDAPNDLAGNLWGKFFPNDRSQLEKSVELALLEAGYIPGSGSEVMLSGFSQGGIVAANLAADADFTGRFNVTTVFTVGSPIGDVPIPSRAEGGPTIVSIEHTPASPGAMGDPVPELDFFVANSQRDGWTTILTPPSNPNPEVFGHNVTDYTESAARELDRSTDPARVALRDEAARFLDGDVTVNYYEFQRG